MLTCCSEHSTDKIATAFLGILRAAPALYDFGLNARRRPGANYMVLLLLPCSDATERAIVRQALYHVSREARSVDSRGEKKVVHAYRL